MKTLGLKRSLRIVITSLIVLALLIACVTSYRMLKRNAVDNLIGRVQQAMTFESKTIQSYIERNSAPAKGLAALYEKYDYQTGHEKLAEIAAVSAGVAKVTIGFDDGASFVSKPSNATFPGGIGIKSKYDPRTRAWYQTGKSNTELALSDIFFTKQNLPMFGATAQIKGGVVLADIRLGQLQGVLESIDVLDGSVGVIVDHKGMILASTAEYAEVKSNLTDVPQYADFAGQILASDSTVNEATINDAETLLFSKQASLLGDAKMFLIMALDSELAFAPITKQTTNLLWTMLIIVVVASVIIYFILDYLYQPVRDLRAVVENLASGECDLTQRLEVRSNDDLGQIASGINRFVEKIQHNMLNVKSQTTRISNGVIALQKQTSYSRDILSQHTNKTDAVVKSMQTLNMSASSVAEQASNAASLMAEANAKGESSINSVASAQSNINGLIDDVNAAANNVERMSQETQDIGSVLSVIGSIAEQTNLLALNAAIEAARAGEQGRGFAVVADEVRALAGRTQESTGEIEGSLNKLRNGAGDVVAAISQTKDTSQYTAKGVGEITESTEQLIEQVNAVDKISAEISSAADEQSQVIQTISDSMGSIHSMVEQLNDTGSKISKETQSISDVNSELDQIVNVFKLD